VRATFSTDAASRRQTDGSNSYWVSEKSDGVRVLLVILTNLGTSEQIVCIVRP
jgi:hypothetical protein